EAARVVAGQVPDRAGRGVACGAPQLVVPLVVPGEELVVTGSVASHPGRNGLGGGILERLDAVAILTGECVQLGGAVLHVVDPVRFFVEVRRRAGRGLPRTGIAAAELVRRPRLARERVCELSVVLCQELRAERHRRRILARGGGVAVRAVLVLEQSLGLARAR